MLYGVDDERVKKLARIEDEMMDLRRGQAWVIHSRNPNEKVIELPSAEVLRLVETAIIDKIKALDDEFDRIGAGIVINILADYRENNENAEEAETDDET